MDEATLDLVYKLIFNVALFFIMMIPGIIIKKCHLASDTFGKGISNFILYVAQPVLVFEAYVQPFNEEILKNSIYVLVISMLMHALFALVAILAFKRAKDSARRMLKMTTVFSNAAFMGIPLIDAVFGSDATIYATIYNITFNLFLWSLGVYFCTENRDMDKNGQTDSKKQSASNAFSTLGKAFVHPVTIAAVLGLLVFCLKLDWLFTTPFLVEDKNLIGESLISIKSLVAPLSMVVIGIRLADINFKGFFKDVYMYVFIFLRHFALPFVTILLIALAGAIGIELGDTVPLVLIIMSATPAASSSTMFAEKFDCDAAYASKLVAFSTILSIVTMPVMLMIANLF